MDEQLKTRLDDLEEQLDELSVEVLEVEFKRLVDKQPQPGLADLQEKHAKLLADADLLAEVEAALDKAGETGNQQYRRLELCRQQVRSALIDQRPALLDLERDLADRIASTTYDVQDQQVDLGRVRDILRANPDRSLRQAAWEAYTPPSQDLAPDLLELVEKRNAAAADMGYDNYAAFKLDQTGLGRQQVTEMLTALQGQTEELYREVLEAGASDLGLDTIEPWDVEFILQNQGGLERSRFPKSGIEPALESWAETVDVDLDQAGIRCIYTDIPYNGLTMRIDEGDIRILANPADGHNYYQTMFHELGHALHGAFKEGSYFFRPEPGLFNESMAEVLGYITRSPGWLAGYGLTDREIETARASILAPWLHFLRQRTAFALFEYQLYDDPHVAAAEHNRRLAEVESSVLGCSYNEQPRWAANGWYISYPIYWQNYVLADVVASQVYGHLEQHVAPLTSSAEAVDFLRTRYWQPGAMVDWQTKVESATGSALTIDYLVNDLHNLRR